MMAVFCICIHVMHSIIQRVSLKFSYKCCINFTYWYYSLLYGLSNKYWFNYSNEKLLRLRIAIKCLHMKSLFSLENIHVQLKSRWIDFFKVIAHIWNQRANRTFWNPIESSLKLVFNWNLNSNNRSIFMYVCIYFVPKLEIRNF